MEKIRFWAESTTTFTSLFLSTLLENNLHEIFFPEIQSSLRVEQVLDDFLTVAISQIMNLKDNVIGL